MKQPTMPNKNLLPPILSNRELEEWNEHVKYTEKMLAETNEAVKELFKIGKNKK